MTFSRTRALVMTAGLVAVLAVAGCTAGSSGPSAAGTSPGVLTSSSSGTPAPTTSAPAGPLVVTTTPKPGAKHVNPTVPITVSAKNGVLSAVTLKNAAGKAVAGRLSADAKTWTASSVLGYAKSYTLKSKARSAAGKTVKNVTKFTTLTPDNMTMPFFNTTGGLAMTDKATYGVGMVVDVHWDESIPNKKAAEKTLSVKTTPAVSGSWYWLDDQNVHWRPRYYYKTGTKVTVSVKDFGVDVGHGLYGEADISTSFTIGAKHVSIADDRTHHVKVYVNDKLARSMPTSMGKGGSQRVNGQTITYWTQRGTYTVLAKNNPVIMDSRTYGLPFSKGGYREAINWATRISTDGVFLHELKSTEYAQGHIDVSHGCLNLNPRNAKWFYQLSRPGDVVIVRHTGGSPLQVWQNGDWSVPWKTWVKGSALT